MSFPLDFFNSSFWLLVRRVFLCLIISESCFFSVQVFAFDFLDKTFLIEFKQGSELTDKVMTYQAGGFDTSGGGKVSFQPWYSTNWTDARVTFMTQLTEHVGLIWGISSGESGQKYTIDPSMKVGIAFHQVLDKRSSISARVTTIVGGNLHEAPCSADYGDIGGVQNVNCRLAASTLQPSQTLQYLFNDRPYNQNTFWVEYKQEFN
ncbi:MAG: hypothetical protein WCK52_03415 [Betaproteobacteria bacterium]|jgi:hypothetical protein